ncbi:hypothetical protein [Neobacillus sp. SuZ13]|uniref:hypothetical protein n=1 Tax=Neobacillus sp. SuZ13 TaxID=3047875 RepID=UPI0024C06E2B|nr:hypothetical protein [Neobacillus sp. SuZ13]WHY65019.1 hypothetical protein QNH17_18080 [Neobacillus sp. SuZ13]
MIEVYQTEDIKAVIEELDAEKSKAFVKHQDEFKKLQMELLESKQSYLKKMVEAKAKYDELVAPERKLDALKIKMGIKKNSYIGNAFETLNMVSVGAGYEPLRIDQKEVQAALWYGKIP